MLDWMTARYAFCLGHNMLGDLGTRAPGPEHLLAEDFKGRGLAARCVCLIQFVFVYLRTMFAPTRRLIAVPLVRALALYRVRIEEEMGAKFLRGVRMGLLAARGTCGNQTRGSRLGSLYYDNKD